VPVWARSRIPTLCREVGRVHNFKPHLSTILSSNPFYSLNKFSLLAIGDNGETGLANVCLLICL